LTTIDKIHASIVYDMKRGKRQAALKGGIANSRKARLREIESEIDREFDKRKKAG